MSKTIEPSEGSGYVVVKHGTYDRSSVLAGQAKRTLLEFYDSVEEAKIDHPKAEVCEYSTRKSSFGCESLADYSGLPTCAPGWFDEANAGEQWDW